jgi:hypothetical protein
MAVRVWVGLDSDAHAPHPARAQRRAVPERDHPVLHVRARVRLSLCPACSPHRRSRSRAVPRSQHRARDRARRPARRLRAEAARGRGRLRALARRRRAAARGRAAPARARPPRRARARVRARPRAREPRDARVPDARGYMRAPVSARCELWTGGDYGCVLPARARAVPLFFLSCNVAELLNHNGPVLHSSMCRCMIHLAYEIQID